MNDEGLRNRFRQPDTDRSSRAPATQTRTDSPSGIFAGKQFKRPILAALIIIGVLGLAAGGYAYFKPNPTKQASNSVFPSIISQQVSIPLYYPQNLPSGYSYNNDAKVIKANVLYISVNGPGQQVFYVTQQAVPASFDFTAFNKKFLNPDNFSADSGTVTAGQIGASLIGSVRTDKNTWIIINSASTSSLTEMETVIRSFELVK